MEIWKDIRGYEEVYVVSNHGRVASLNRIQKDKNGKEVRHKGKILLPHSNSRGYLRVQLKHKGTKKVFFVHRLVAMHFVDNPAPEKYSIVNHIDSNYLNNRADNLEWTTYRGNVLHAIANGRMKRTQEWMNHLRESNEKKGKTIVGTNIDTGEVIRFVCLNDCKVAGFQPSCVCNCCQGKRKSHKGYIWRNEK